MGTDWARYLLDGEPNSMRATFELNPIDHSSRIQPYSRVELTESEFFVQLFFMPRIELNALDPLIDNVILELRTEGAPALFDLHVPPQDLGFLALLPQRRFEFLGQDWWGGPYAVADTLVVPEPASGLVLALGAAAVLTRRMVGIKTRL